MSKIKIDIMSIMMGKKRKVQKFNEICEIDVLNHVKKVGGG
jgi:hypothetical protein